MNNKFQLGETVAIREVNFNRWEERTVAAIMIVGKSFAYQFYGCNLWNDEADLHKATIVRNDLPPGVMQQLPPSKKD